LRITVIVFVSNYSGSLWDIDKLIPITD
jgi:hypothetical protein